jgi:tRNA nucleotidyltransferase/poly(A) polymerase
MKNELATLKKLAKYFDKPLYVVGGAVRNTILGLPTDDIDLAAAISPEEVFCALEGSPFKVSHTSRKLFTLSIRGDGKKYEFTSFRVDSYDRGHTPTESKLTDDIATDAKRRDFTMNAIYYDITNGEYVDPLGGIADAKKGIIRTVVQPQEVFSQDGLRLMRLARQAAELDMEIAPDTLASAQSNAALIKDIAAERVRDELMRIIAADSKYDKPNAHVKGLLLLDKIGVLDFILPELVRCKGVKQRRDYHIYDVFNHILKAYEHAQQRVRLAAIFHDLAKPISINPDGSMRGHDIKGQQLAREVMNRLAFSNADIEFVVRLVALHMYDLKCDAKESTLRAFIQQNHDIIDDLAALKEADYLASGVKTGECVSAIRLTELYKKMKSEGVPLSIKDLKVGGADLIQLGIPEKSRGIALKRLLKAASFGGEMLERQKQLEYITKNKRSF